MKKVPLSIAIITKNEENNIKACLQSVSFACQLVVVDSGSTDETLMIASAFGCETYQEAWRGFGHQKQAAIEKCTQPWILVLDADERIPQQTAEAIKSIVCAEDIKEAGFSFPRKNFFQGRWIRHAGWWPDDVIRLFRKGAGKMTEASVHEAVEICGTVRKLDVPIEHFTESSLSKVLQKIDKYSTLGANQAFEEGRRSSIPSACSRALFTFVQNYFIRLGMLDGRPGLTLAVTDAVNKFFKYAKLSELERTCPEGKNDPNRQDK